MQRSKNLSATTKRPAARGILQEALKHLDGLSYAELAERLEIPRGTVMSRLYFARKKLEAKLNRKFYHRKEAKL